MKLSEFLAWWDAFVKANCDGIQADIRVSNEFRDVLVFRFTREMMVDGASKILSVQRCQMLGVIESPNGLEDLTGFLKEAVCKLKAGEAK